MGEYDDIQLEKQAPEEWIEGTERRVIEPPGKPTLAMGLGIAALVCTFSIVLTPVGLILGIASCMTAARLKNGSQGEKKAKTGKIFGIISIVISTAALCAVIVPRLVSTYSASIDVQKTQSSSSASSSKSTSSSSVLVSFVPQSANKQNAVEHMATNTKYANATYGYTLNLPDGFEFIEENISGAIYMNKKLSMTVIVIGSDNTEHKDAGSLAKTQWGGSAKAKTQTDDNSVLMYRTQGSLTYVYLAYVDSNTINEVKIEYANNSLTKAEALKATQEIVNSFTPGFL